MPRILFFLFALTMALPAANAQKKTAKNKPRLSPEAIEQLKAAEDTLAVLAYAVVNDSIEAERFASCKLLITHLVKALKTPNSFYYPFDRLRSISILAPPDSSFRIFTWQLFVNDSTYRYYGSIQMNQQELKLFPLIDRSFELPSMPLEQQLTADRWYGALYYNLLPLGNGRDKKYLLFGFDNASFFEKRKILEVLSFDASGQPVFGAPIFHREKALKPESMVDEYRVILEYYADGNVRLNWDEQYQMILFEHLELMPNPAGRGMVYLPDGSYEGFKLEKGNLKYVEKVFNQVSDELPRPEPILDERSKNDLFGKKKKG